MASNVLLSYPADSTFTCTLASLTNNSARQSTVIDNSSNLDLDALVQLQIKSGASGTATTGYVACYVFATADAGTTYTENAGATDAAITLTSPTNLLLLGIVNVVANATTYKGPVWSVASLFGGNMPKKWGIVIQNLTGGTLDSTEGSHKKLYTRVINTVG
jgi:hypothetical protein